MRKKPIDSSKSQLQRRRKAVHEELLQWMALAPIQE
jgi:hypothetical protein